MGRSDYPADSAEATGRIWPRKEPADGADSGAHHAQSTLEWPEFTGLSSASGVKDVLFEEVRPEEPRDFADIRMVHERAFAPSREEADLVEALCASRARVPELCLVALRGGAVVAHIAFSRARLESAHPVLVLAPLAVIPGHQRQGFGSALVSEALRRAAETDFLMVVVVGHPTYYPRFGFEPAAALGIVAPFEVPTEAWMLYRLPAYRQDARGTIVFPAAFGL